MLKIVFIFLWGLCFVSVNLMAKKTAMMLITDEGAWKLFLSAVRCPYAYVVILLYGATAFFYMILLRLMPLSVIGPIVLSLGVVLLVLAGSFFLRENVIDARQIIGIALTLAGILILQTGRI